MCRGLAASAKLKDEITFQRTHRATTSVKDLATHLYRVVFLTGPPKGAGSFHIHRKTMKELGTLAVLGVREQPNLAQNLVTHRH